MTWHGLISRRSDDMLGSYMFFLKSKCDVCSLTFPLATCGFKKPASTNLEMQQTTRKNEFAATTWAAIMKLNQQTQVYTLYSHFQWGLAIIHMWNRQNAKRQWETWRPCWSNKHYKWGKDTQNRYGIWGYRILGHCTFKVSLGPINTSQEFLLNRR